MDRFAKTANIHDSRSMCKPTAHHIQNENYLTCLQCSKKCAPQFSYADVFKFWTSCNSLCDKSTHASAPSLFKKLKAVLKLKTASCVWFYKNVL